MLIAVCPNESFDTVTRTDKIEIIDTDDGVMEEAYLLELHNCGLKVENMVYRGGDTEAPYAAIIDRQKGINHYSCEDYLFIYEANKVYAIIGNDKYFEVSVVRNHLVVNSELQGYATTLGIPCRYSTKSPFFVTVYYSGDFERTVYLQEKDAIYKKGIRSQLLRKLLY